jgi:hypothetical protein
MELAAAAAADRNSLDGQLAGAEQAAADRPGLDAFFRDAIARETLARLGHERWPGKTPRSVRTMIEAPGTRRGCSGWWLSLRAAGRTLEA